MTYKEKHLHQAKSAFRKAFNTLALSAAFVLATGCENSPKSEDKQSSPNGLLDSTFVRTTDKYNTKITVDLVNVPVYNKLGERKKDCYVLTRGIKYSTYSSPNNKTAVCRAYINGSNVASYVMINQDRAVLTEAGFSGLFVDSNNRVVLIADENVPEFVKEQQINNIYSQNSAENKAKADTSTKAKTAESLPDSVLQNNVQAQNDSISQEIHIITKFHPLDTLKEQNSPEIADSVLINRQNIRD